MDLSSICKNKNDYYKLANDYLKNIDSNELDISFDKIISKSISILMDHDFIPTPCIPRFQPWVRKEEHHTSPTVETVGYV